MPDGSYEVVFYRSPRGECFAEEFLDGLQAKVRGKVLRWIEALETHGPNLPRPYADVVRGKVRELRIVFWRESVPAAVFLCGEADRDHAWVRQEDRARAGERTRSGGAADMEHKSRNGSLKGGRRFRDYLKEQLKDQAVREAYEEEGLFVELAIQIGRLRQRRGLSQRALAKRLHTSQQTISRLESPRNGSLSLRTLVKLAHALGKEVKVQFV